MSSIVRNSFFMGLFNLFGRASGLVRYLLLVTLLSPSGFSIISFALSFGRLGRHFTDGGLDNLISRDGARDTDKVPKLLFHGLVMKAILACCFLTAGLMYLTLVRGKESTELLVILTALAGSLMLSMTGVLRSGFTAIEKMEYVFYTNLPSRFISIVVLALVLWAGCPLVFVASAISLENILWFILLGVVTLRFFSLHPAISFSTIRYMISESWSLALYGFFNIFYLSLDVVMIDYLMGVESVAPYTYASLLIEGITMLVSGYLIAIYPVLSRTYQTDEETYHKLFRKSVVVLAIITLPASFLMGTWSQGWMGLISNSPDISAPVLKILAVTMNLSMLNTLLIVIFTSRNRQRWLVLFTGGAVGISFVANELFIPLYGQIGAAVASLFSQCILLLVMGSVALQLFHLRVPLVKPLAVLAAAGLSSVVVWMIPKVPLLLVPVLFGVLFLGIAWLMRIVTPQEMYRLMKSIKE